jgi:uncharacterized protein YyaL (SSP411 family)
MRLKEKMKRTTFLLLPVLIMLQITTSAQVSTDQTRIQLLYSGINENLKDTRNGLFYETTDSVHRGNPHSWLWPLCAYLQAANEMENTGSGERYMLPVERAIDLYYSDKSPLPAYQDYVTRERPGSRFYDDNQWIAIAYLDAYSRHREKRYMRKAQMICRFMLGGLDSVAGGGIYWKEGDYQTKNTCSNGPAVLVLLQLYRITHQAQYLDKALAIYQWTNKYLQADQGFYYDNIRTGNLKVGKATFTYNTGTMLQSNVLFYQVTGDQKYLTEAQRIATAGREHFFRAGRLPDGNYWFNAVMLRGYEALYQVDQNKLWIDFFRQDADAIWNTERDANNMVGPKPVKSLLDQAAMIEIYARLSHFKL